MRFASGMFFGKGLDLLVVQQVHILVAHLIEVVLPLDAHGRDLHPVAVLPVAAGADTSRRLISGLKLVAKA